MRPLRSLAPAVLALALAGGAGCAAHRAPAGDGWGTRPPVDAPPPTRAVVHLHRAEGGYGGWGLAVTELLDGRTAGRRVGTVRAPLPPTGSDGFGAYWELRLADFPSGQVALAVVDGGRPDLAGRTGRWTLAESGEAWLNAGDPRVYLRQELAIAEWPP